MAKDRTNKVQKSIRVSTVMEWLIAGKPTHEILKLGTEMWDVSTRTVEDYIRLARQEFVKEYESLDRKELVSTAMKKFDHLYTLGIQQRQLAVSIAAAQAQLKMVGCDSPKN